MTTNELSVPRVGYPESGIAWNQLQIIIEAMPDGVAIVDESGHVVAVNEEFERALGYRRDRLLARSVETLMPEALQQEHRLLRERFKQQPLARPMGAGRDLKAQHADGREVPVDIALRPLTIEGRKMVLVALRDASERFAAAQQIRRLNDELEERVRRRTAELEAANRQLEAYSYTVSHELKSPLRLVRGFTELLNEELGAAVNREAQHHLHHIISAARRMSRIVEGLLALARLDHHSLEYVEVDMTELAKSVVEEVREEQSVQSISFTVARLPNARGDTVLLHQVFTNLIANAVKYCRDHEHTKVSVSGHVDADRVVYEVRDNGPGFDPEHARAVFDPFCRLTGAEAFEGLGIGLTLARRIVERHGGGIWAEGRAGEGAAFFFWLPS